MLTLLRLYSLLQMVRPIKAATDSNGNGYLTSALSLQFSTDGTTWYDSGWRVSPAYPQEIHAAMHGKRKPIPIDTESQIS